MGVAGLLPYLKKATKEANISQFAGQAAAIDVYCWLHKGAFSCAEKILKGEKTDGYVHYCLKMVNVVKAAGVKPILVFDGRRLPSKHLTEKKRREARQLNKQKAKELLREGKLREARELFQRAVDITPEMAQEAIEACREKNIDFIVAPYEADAQLAYLNKIGIVQLVITEDSDLVLFGCDKILYKMDVNGCGSLYDQSLIGNCLGNRAGHFTFEKFRQMCILSGCDYVASLPGIGLGKATKFFALTSNPNLEQTLPKLPTYLKMPQLDVTLEYIRDFLQAEQTFLYQLVFCPRQRKLVPLNPYPDGLGPEDLPYAGEYLPDNVALELAQGKRHLNTLQPISASQEWGEDCRSMWSPGFQTSGSPAVAAPKSAFTCTSSTAKSSPSSTPAAARVITNKPKAVTPANILEQYGGGRSSPDRKRLRISSSPVVRSKYFADKPSSPLNGSLEDLETKKTGFAWSSSEKSHNPFKVSPRANAPFKMLSSSQPPTSFQNSLSSQDTFSQSPLSQSTPSQDNTSSVLTPLSQSSLSPSEENISDMTPLSYTSSILTPLSQSSSSPSQDISSALSPLSKSTLSQSQDNTSSVLTPLSQSSLSPPQDNSSSVLNPVFQNGYQEHSLPSPGEVGGSAISLDGDPVLEDIAEILSQSSSSQKENSSPASRPSKRPVGLSKKSRPDSQPSIKDSLLRFQFTRR